MVVLLLSSRTRQLMQYLSNFELLIKAAAISLIPVLTVVACASTPNFNLEGTDQKVKPRDVVASPEAYRSKKVLWGGLIINSSNVKSGTRLELLAYPLDRRLKPDINKDALGRVMAYSDGYLETLDYASGRLLTVTGMVQGIEKAPVGEAMYSYPVVNIAQIHLWPEQDASGESRVHFGIGVVIH
jgi:outer membrane lipoprotein